MKKGQVNKIINYIKKLEKYNQCLIIKDYLKICTENNILICLVIFYICAKLKTKLLKLTYIHFY